MYICIHLVAPPPRAARLLPERGGGAGEAHVEGGVEGADIHTLVCAFFFKKRCSIVI